MKGRKKKKMKDAKILTKDIRKEIQMYRQRNERRKDVLFNGTLNTLLF